MDEDGNDCAVDILRWDPERECRYVGCRRGRERASEPKTTESEEVFMKKLRFFCALMGALLVAGALCPGFSALASAVMLPVPAAETNPLKTEDVSIRVNLETGRLEARMLLSNPSSDWTGEVELPGFTEAAAEGTAVVLVNGEACLYSGEPLTLTVPAEGETQIDWACDLVSPQRITYYAVELSDLVYGEDTRIGRLSVDFILEEADVPLVTEITPVNYTYDADTCTVNVTLYDFEPSSILSRVSLTRDTEESILGNREFEPNEEQLFCWEHYGEWLENGIERSEEEYWPGNAFETMYGLDPDIEYEDWEERQKIGYYALGDHTGAFERLYHYAYYRDHLEDITPDMFTNGSWEMPILLGDMYAEVGDLTNECFCVSEVPNPSLANDELTVQITESCEWDDELGGCVYEYEYRTVSEQACLETPEDSSFVLTDVMPSHVLIVPLSAGASTEEILAACEALGVSMIVRTQLYDGVRNEVPTYTWTWYDYDENGNELDAVEESETVYRYIAYSGEENYEAAKAAAGMTDPESEYDSFALTETDDPVVANAEIPAFLLYRGYTYLDDEGRTMVRFWDSYYLGYDCGLTQHAAVSDTERGQELAAAAEARLAAKVEAARSAAETQFPDPADLAADSADGDAETAAEPSDGEPAEKDQKNAEPSEESDVQPSGAGKMPDWAPAALAAGAVVLAGAAVILIVSVTRAKKRSAAKHSESRRN